ncbi:MAG: hypothetical protein DDG60_14185 [Anaerolineae bacterium]|nr:MAG: hypothetical protein DDG60_14185 [Anaerolineae bacterium]
MNTPLRSRPFNPSINKFIHALDAQRGRAFGFMIIGALLAFELFNFSTTEFALHDVLGNLKFMGIKWSTILAIAFCGIDFAGIARLFTPEQGADEPAEVWYLFGAWILAAAMNATLTWWGVSVAIANHNSQGAAVIGSETVRTVVPVFVAVMVWVIRILIIGTFALAGERIFSQADQRLARTPARPSVAEQPVARPVRPTASTNPAARSFSPQTTAKYQPQHRPTYAAPQASIRSGVVSSSRPEPTYEPTDEPVYHNLMSARELLERNQMRR